MAGAGRQFICWQKGPEEMDWGLWWPTSLEKQIYCGIWIKPVLKSVEDKPNSLQNTCLWSPSVFNSFLTLWEKGWKQLMHLPNMQSILALVWFGWLFLCRSIFSWRGNHPSFAEVVYFCVENFFLTLLTIFLLVCCFLSLRVLQVGQKRGWRGGGGPREEA